MKALLITLLLVGSLSAAPYIDTKSVLAEMDKDSFGNAVLSLVHLNMNAESPVDEILLVLDEVITQLEDDQKLNDRKNATDQAFCDDTLANLAAQVSAGDNTIAQLQKSIADNSEIVSQATQDLDQAARDYEETVKSIQVNHDERVEAHDKWVASDAELSDTIIAVDEATKLIQHMIHGVSFAQIKGRYDKVMDKLQTNKSKHAQLFKPIVLALSQLATKLNFENVQKILELLATIRASLVDSQENDRIAEQRAQKDWETLDAELNNQKVALADKKARLSNLIVQTNEILVQLTQSLEAKKVELESTYASISETTAWCDRTSRFYESESEEIERQLSILNKLSEHLEEKFGAVSDFIQVRKY